VFYHLVKKFISRFIPLLLQGNFLFMRNIYLVFIGCLLGITSCNNSNNTSGATQGDNANTQTKVGKEPVHSKLSDAGTQVLMDVVSKYYSLKNALVATKAARADSAATQLAGAADSMMAFLQKDSANIATLKPYMDTILSQSKAVNAIKDETCERQRIVFETISRNMYALLKAADLKNARIYHQYCPMAFNERGAYWLSDNAEIFNPYFGKKMLECGEIADSL